MVLPSETEERVKRRALSVCQDHIRKVLNLTRKIPQMIESFIQDDEKQARIFYEEITNSRKEVDTARRFVSQELAEIGAILLSREDFMRFTNWMWSSSQRTSPFDAPIMRTEYSGHDGRNTMPLSMRSKNGTEPAARFWWAR